MSLVSEALKKAEREAAARDARAKGQPAPFEAPLQPFRSRHAGGRNRALVAALALVAGAAAIATALLLLRPEGRKEAPAMEGTAAVPEARALAKDGTAGATEGLAVPTALPGVQQAPGPERSVGSNPFARPQSTPRPSAQMDPLLPEAPTPPSPASAAPPTMPNASEPTAPPLTTPPLPRTTQRPPPPAPSVSEPPASKPARLLPAPVRPISNGSGDYLRSVEFPDGTTLELGGIVYSEAAPFAYLNGRLVGVGEFVLGRRIDRIERDKVLLSGEGGEITLRLKAP